MIAVRRRLALAGALLTTLVVAPGALADGTETLGDPSIPITSGTGVLVAGVGTQEHPDAPVSFDVNVPSGALIKQVLLYWEGHHTAPTAVSGDDTISVNGNMVTGTLIGGPTTFFEQRAGGTPGSERFSTYRKDITDLRLVQAGANTLTVSDMSFMSNFPSGSPFNQGNDGAGVVVIYDNGGPSKVVGLKDGLDLAYANFEPPLDTTVAQTFNFTSAGFSRSGTLGVLAGSVSGPDLSGVRGNVITGTFDTGQTFSFVNPLQSGEGDEFDAKNLPISVPAGASSLTVQALSEGGSLPASFAWIVGTVAIEEPPPPPPGGQGCTPGYWKNHLDAWGPAGFSPNQALSTVFSQAGLGTLASDSLLAALKYKGGSTLTAKKQILLRAAVASVLNAGHPGVSFGSTPAQIISAVNAALESNDETKILALATELDDRNNAGCKLN